MAVLSTELVAFLILAFVLRAFTKNEPLYQKWMHNIPFFVYPEPRHLKLLADTRHKVGMEPDENSTTADGTDLRPSWWASTLRERIDNVIEYSKVFIQAGNDSRVVPWAKLWMGTELDLVVLTLAQLILLYSASAIWSCIRGVPPQETSFYLCMMSLVLGVYVMGASMFRHGSSSYEWPLTGIMAGFGFVGSLLALQAPESVLDTKLQAGLADASSRAGTVMQAIANTTGADSLIPPEEGFAPWLLGVHFAVAAVCAVVSGLFVLPALRFASCFVALRAKKELSWAQYILLHANMFMPMVTAALWIRPVLGSLVLAPDLIRCNESDPSKDCAQNTNLKESWLLNESQWLAIRLGAVLLCCVLRCAQFRLFTQAYLEQNKVSQGDYLEETFGGFGSEDAAKNAKKAAKAARKKGKNPTEAASKASNMPIEVVQTALQQCISIAGRNFRSLTVVAMQLVAPVAVTLAFALALHRRGHVAMGVCDAVHSGAKAAGMGPWLEALASTEPATVSGLDQIVGELLGNVADGMAVSRDLFASPLLWRPLFGFWLWWCVLSWAVASALALLYFDTVARGTGMARDELRMQAQSLRRSAAGGNAPAPVVAAAADTPATSNKKKGKKGRQGRKEE